MKHSALFGFVEFKNTKAAKKAVIRDVKGGISLTVSKITSPTEIVIRFSKGLIASMKANKFTTFKLMFNELTNQIALVADYSNNAINVENSSTFEKGRGYTITNKYIKYTFRPEFENKDIKSFVYQGRYLVDDACYIFDKK